MELKVAKRKFRYLKIGIGGLPGVGKTYGALLLAKGLCGDWSKIAVIDTENESACNYADLGPFSTLSLPLEKTSPEGYIEAINKIKAAKQFEVLIIDSITHEWSGPMGCLQRVEEVAKTIPGKNSFAAWAKVTPVHNNFSAAWLYAPIHTICTMRQKDDYLQTKDDHGKSKIEKVGLKNITREGIEYEFDVSFDGVDRDEHLFKVEKDRTSIFRDARAFRLSEDIGKAMIEWSRSGAHPEDFTYDPTKNDHKVLLAEKCREAGILEPAAMKKISDALTGKSFLEFKNEVRS